MTIVVLPVGIPLLGVARRFLTSAVQLILPRSLAHPVNEVTETVKKSGKTTGKKLQKAVRKSDKLMA
ncbi:hypothetical protein [Mycobacterium sp. JS623]|uniref:hypothetical protein n=1 Tax=Mycobacterium sp. JS623 TaxID=212767 RepID=UPI001E2D6841|nr:hypothetical protein [Mycobacterium sp. JS623]